MKNVTGLMGGSLLIDYGAFGITFPDQSIVSGFHKEILRDVLMGAREAAGAFPSLVITFPARGVVRIYDRKPSDRFVSFNRDELLNALT